MANNLGPVGASAWIQGAKGEEFVGSLLAPLKKVGWTILNDLELGPDAGNVDHLAIGPQGVFVIDTKNVSGMISVAANGIAVAGWAKDYSSRVISQAQEVRERLLRSTRRQSLWVQGVLAFVDASMDVTGFPQNVLVVRAENLVSVLVNAPEERALSRDALRELAQAAKNPRTWT